MASIKLVESIAVNCSVEDAFVLMLDINNHVELFSNNREIRDFHGGPVKEGDKWIMVGSFMGRETITTYTMEEINEPSKLVYKQSSSAADGVITWEFQPVDGATLITSTGEGEPKGFFASLAASLLKGNTEKLMRENLEHIKARLEA